MFTTITIVVLLLIIWVLVGTVNSTLSALGRMQESFLDKIVNFPAKIFWVIVYKVSK